MALTDKLTAIGDAIRAKNGTTAKLSLTDMPTAISNIKTTPNLTTLEVTANGTYTAASANFDGYSTVTVNVPSSGGSSSTDDQSHTWRDGTWSDISNALDDIYNNNADPSTYFTVGDVRNSIDGNSKQFVITGLNHDTLATPVKGHTTAALTFMTTNDYYKSSYYGSGDYVTSGMQNYINGYAGRLPEYSGDIVPLLKNVVKKYSTCNSKTSPPTTENTVTCKLFLPSLAEVFSQSALQGKLDYNSFFMLDPNAGSQYDLFKGDGKIWYIAMDETTLCQKSLYRDTYVTSSGTYYPITESDYFHGFRFSSNTVGALRVMGCL